MCEGRRRWLISRRKKKWQKTVGKYGYKVAVWERSPNHLYLRWWDPSRGNSRWKSLRHGDRDFAVQQAKQVSAQLYAEEEASNKSIATVRTVLNEYLREVGAHLRGQGPMECELRVRLWIHFLGADRDVLTVDRAVIDRFVRERRAGRIKPPNRKLTKNPSDSTIGADIGFLQTTFNWATTVTRPNGTPLLSRNPIHGYKRPRNKNPSRPVATYDRYLAMREVADQVDPQGLFKYLLDLSESLGWRVTSLLQLRAADVSLDPAPDAPHGILRKRGEVDKMRVDGQVPLPELAAAALRDLLKAGSKIGDAPLFPAPKNPAQPWGRYHARRIFKRAEKTAELEPMKRGNFHPFRRKWATERKHWPDKDVMEVGGWSDATTLKNCYQQADAETMYKVVSEPTKLRDTSNRSRNCSNQR